MSKINTYISPWVGEQVVFVVVVLLYLYSRKGSNVLQNTICLPPFNLPTTPKEVKNLDVYA